MREGLDIRRRVESFGGYFKKRNIDPGIILDSSHLYFDENKMEGSATLRLLAKDPNNLIYYPVEDKTRDIDAEAKKTFGAEAELKKWAYMSAEDTGFGEMYFQRYLFH